MNRRDLTESGVDRQNILNNPYAVAEIEKATGITGLVFEGKSVLPKDLVAEFFEVTPRTIDTYIEKDEEELRQNGYEVIRGKRLKELKLLIYANDVDEADFVNIRAPKRLNLTHLGCIFLLVTASATVRTAHGLNRTMEGAVEFSLWPTRAIMAMSQPVESEPEMAQQAAQELSAAAARQTKP